MAFRSPKNQASNSEMVSQIDRQVARYETKAPALFAAYQSARKPNATAARRAKAAPTTPKPLYGGRRAVMARAAPRHPTSGRGGAGLRAARRGPTRPRSCSKAPPDKLGYWHGQGSRFSRPGNYFAPDASSIEYCFIPQ